MLSVSTERLFSAIDNANVGEFAAVLKNGADVNAFDDVGNTPLMNVISAWAIDGDNEEMYKSMINSLLRSTNINVNVQNREQSNTALHMAISFKNLDAVKLLLEHPDIDFYIRNNYEVEAEMYDIPISYTVNRYNCTALEYARKLGTDEIQEEIEKKIENGIYKHSVLLYKVKFLLKASPHIAKALIVTELGAILVASIIGSLSTLSILCATFAISIPLYLLNRFIYKNCVTSRYFDKRKEILLCGLGSLYYFYLMADIYCGKGYFFASQLLFTVGTPLFLLEEVSSAIFSIVNVCQSSEVLFPALLGGIIGFMLGHMLLVCTLAYIMTNKNSEGPSRPAEGHEAHYLPDNSLADLALVEQQNIRSV